MNSADIIIIAVLAVIIIRGVIVSIKRRKKGGCGCGCSGDCDSCSKKLIEENIHESNCKN